MCTNKVGFLFIAAILQLAASAGEAAFEATFAERISVLIFSKTQGYRHRAIPDALTALISQQNSRNWAVDTTEDAGRFTSAHLSKYDVVVFALTSGDVLNNEQQTAFETYMKEGGGYVGIHSASDTEYQWSFYGKVSSQDRWQQHVQPQGILAVFCLLPTSA